MSETSPEAPARVSVEIHLDEADTATAKRELRSTLAETPRRIPSKYFYDDRGSELFERICELPEYYPTRAEAKLLSEVAPEIVSRTGARELVELGSGAATKTRILLDAMAEAGQLRTYVPVDVSEGIVHRVAEELIVEYPGLEVHGLVADFMTDLGELPAGDHRLVAFLGGTIGNLERETEAVDFLEHARAAMAAEDHLVIGTDLIKDVAVIEAAYNDAQGVTAEFNLNALRVVNQRFGGDFDPGAFTHRAFYDRRKDRIEMRLVSRRPQKVRLEALDLEFELAEGEEILTEISTKFDRPRLEKLYASGGFELIGFYTGSEGLFALSLARPI